MSQVYILGAGLSGALAAILNSDATVIEGKQQKDFMTSPEHKAVLRFRSDKISKITGIPFRFVQVRKSIWYERKEYRLPDIRFTNLYSRKVANGYYDRSIVNLETVPRYIPPENFHALLIEQIKHRTMFGSPVQQLAKSSVTIKPREGAGQVLNCPAIISTIAMPITAKLLGVRSPVEFSSGRKVWVRRYRVSNCDLNLSMYYPSVDTPVYRASVMKDLLSVESVKDLTDDEDVDTYMNEVFDSLGLDVMDTTFLDQGSQLGKLDYAVDDSVRKNFILKLTLEYGIYSLGRFAIWKNILQDDVYDDALRIRGWVGSGTHYDMMRESICAQNA